MKAVIHQPYFIPWMGYFSKLVYADKFIVLDNVRFSKRHFIDRVQIINASGELTWIGMNIWENYKKRCNEIYLKDKSIVENIIKIFYSAYSKAKYFKETIRQIENILHESFIFSEKITDINIHIIIKLMELLDIEVSEIVFASQYWDVEDATWRLIYLLQKNVCDTIITGNGGSLEKHNIWEINKSWFQIFVQDYYKLHPEYYQTRRTKIWFAKWLSILDCIFNEWLEKTKLLLLDQSCIPRIYN